MKHNPSAIKCFCFGCNRARALTPARRTEIARKAATIQWAMMTDEERSEMGRKWRGR